MKKKTKKNINIFIIFSSVFICVCLFTCCMASSIVNENDNGEPSPTISPIFITIVISNTPTSTLTTNQAKYIIETKIAARTPTTTPTVIDAKVSDTPMLCYKEYPDFCIPLYAKLTCEDIEIHNFKVEGGDPLHLDRDNDGVACER